MTNIEDKKVRTYSIHCPYCDSENIEMIGDAEYNDWWHCETCDKEFSTFVQKEVVTPQKEVDK